MRLERSIPVATTPAPTAQPETAPNESARSALDREIRIKLAKRKVELAPPASSTVRTTKRAARSPRPRRTAVTQKPIQKVLVAKAPAKKQSARRPKAAASR